MAAGLLLAVLTGAAPATSAQAPAPGNVTALLERYVAAVGGRAALEKLTSATARGTVEIADFGISGTIQVTQQAPASFLSAVDLAGVGVTREGYDGTTAWEESPQTGIREKTGAELAEAKLTAAFPRELQLTALYPGLTLKPREKVAGRDVDVLEAPAPSGPIRMYFDAETAMLVRQVMTRITPQGPVEVVTDLSDYRPIDGVMRAFTLRQVAAAFTAVIQLTEVKHNTPVDAALFKKPVR